VAAGFDESIARVRDALQEEGFGVLTEIDVRATLKKNQKGPASAWHYRDQEQRPDEEERQRRRIGLGGADVLRSR
jgi:hypothetical protein